MVIDNLEYARALAIMVEANEQEGQEYYFDNSLYNVQENMGFVKHAFILSMYALVKVPSKALNQAYNWAMY